jgi:F-type H+-transporting ATPase subunit delta
MMRETTIARNYAETLLTLARRAEDLPGWGKLIGDVANAMRSDTTLWRVLESPKVSEALKSAVLSEALADRVPRLFLKFLQAMVHKRRQMLMPQVSDEYNLLIDEVEGRVHANVTMSRDASDEDRTVIAEQLSRVLGKTVVPHVTVNPAILGGVIVRVGDTVMDGSVRKRLATLRSRMLAH